jgi:SAM-dependent methyltransferase
MQLDAPSHFGARDLHRGPATRLGVVWQALTGALGAGPASVLDCGGGSGSFAVPLASLGHQVTVVDISADALATLERRAAERTATASGGSVVPVQGDVENLAEAVGHQQFDAVLAHGILGAVDDVRSTFAAIVAATRPGGLLSIVVDNPVAAVLARALGGDVPAALEEFRALDAGTRPGPDTVRTLARDHGLLLEQVHGVGVFAELVPGRAIDSPDAREALAELEMQAATRSPFTEIASRVHLLARRPA